MSKKKILVVDDDDAIRQILIDKGLMVVDPDNGRVIWEETRAVPQRACYVYVNVKGRDPQGIVEPGAEFETVRDRIVEALKHESGWVRLHAAIVLVAIGDRARAAAPQMEEAISANREGQAALYIRWALAHALDNLGERR